MKYDYSKSVKIILVLTGKVIQANNILPINNKLYYLFDEFFLGDEPNHVRHLFVIIDEEIKTGDYYYSFVDGKICYANDKYFKLPSDRKIIGTTDNKYGVILPNIPNIPSHFIRQYVDFFNRNTIIRHGKVETDSDGRFKLSRYGELTISPDKIEFTKQEVEELLMYCTAWVSAHPKMTADEIK
jgi:hypothetical protein